VSKTKVVKAMTIGWLGDWFIGIEGQLLQYLSDIVPLWLFGYQHITIISLLFCLRIGEEQLHRIRIFKEAYDVLHAYMIGKSGKNALYMAKYIDFFQTQFTQNIICLRTTNITIFDRYGFKIYIVSTSRITTNCVLRNNLSSVCSFLYIHVDDLEKPTGHVS
jgi:hypothetical protein